MEPYVPSPCPALPITTGGFVGVRRILCIGKNYSAHAAEMGDPGARPIHFLKSPDALLAADGSVVMPYPPRTTNLHHEVELVLSLGSGGRDLAPAEALSKVFGYAVGLDMTRRDLQAQAKAKGGPWAAAKDFDASAIVGPIHPVAVVGHPSTGRICVSVDGEIRQDGDLSEMTWDVPHLLAELSSLMTLLPGDLVFTGTPEGVGPVVAGQVMRAEIAGLGSLHVTVG